MRQLTTRSVVVIAVLLVAVVGGSVAFAASVTSNTLGRAYGYKAAVQYTAKAEKGTNTNVSAVKRPAAKNKKIFIISAGQASISSQIPADGALAAAKAIGWNATILDGKLDPSIYGSLVNQAVAEGANGIVLDAVDCSTAESGLRKAKAAGIKVVSIYSFDCNDPVGGDGGPSLITTCVNFNNLACSNLGAFTESYGRDQANYIIANSHNKANVLVLQDPEYTVLKYTAAGFDDQIAHSGGSKVVTTLNFTVADLGTKLTQMIQAELLKYPNITWIKSPYTYATIDGLVQAIANQPGKYKVMGGEGFQPELQLIQKHTITAVNIVDSTWQGWGAIDSLNSVFTGKKTYPSGIGWIIADATHNVPADANYVPPINFMAEYEKAWGR